MAFLKNTTAFLLAGLCVIAACKKDPEPGQALPPAISIADISELEGNAAGTISFKVTLSEASKNNVLVNYATLDGTAKAGVDFTGKADGELIFNL